MNPVDLIQRLRIKAAMIELGEKIAWGSDSALMHEAADTLAAHEMLSKYPDAPFTACWFRRADGQIQYSLRSEDSRLDVSEVAKSLGGGGHRNAAGFQQATTP